MRRAMMLVAVGALLLTLVAEVAVARTYTCNDSRCPGTDRRDVITGDRGDQTFRLYDGNDVGRGKRGHDLLFGDWGSDDLYGNLGADVLSDRDGRGDYDELIGGRGNDVLRANDGDERDFGNCGPGDDTLRVDSEDEADSFSNCEEVEVVGD
jgi:Ca2+-binding RTX toxin-like protein